jgi:hypothetical protein
VHQQILKQRPEIQQRAGRDLFKSDGGRLSVFHVERNDGWWHSRSWRHVQRGYKDLRKGTNIRRLVAAVVWGYWEIGCFTPK